MPLSLRTMLAYNHPQIKGDFIPLDYEDINKWRTHIDGTTDITDFNLMREGELLKILVKYPQIGK